MNCIKIFSHCDKRSLEIEVKKFFELLQYENDPSKRVECLSVSHSSTYGPVSDMLHDVVFRETLTVVLLLSGPAASINKVIK